MAISVTVPKDLSRIKTKVAFNLTKRQLICFGCAGVVGFSFYLLTKNLVGTQAASLLMVAVVMPFFILATFERDGFPAEKILYFMIRQRFLMPGIRPYRSENIYRQMEERERLRKEMYYLEEKAKGRSRAESFRKEKAKRNKT